MLTRRSFLQTATVAAAAAQSRPKRLAIVATIYRLQSHAQHMGDRFLAGYPYGGEWHKADMKVVSLYVDQKPAGDLSGARAREFGFRVYPTIAEALRCGGKELAVDAVLIIAEHGDYPRNEKGQILYPRYEFFEQCIQVFEQSSRAVPVYNDKALSYSFEKAKNGGRLRGVCSFRMLAGSSLPVTWRLPAIELPLGCHIEEALMVGEGGSDAMDFHALEGLQCMVERRRGGETRRESRAAIWKATRSGRPWTRAATRRTCLPPPSPAATPRSASPLPMAARRTWSASGELRVLAKNPAAYFIEYRDGLKATMLMLDGALKDFNFAARVSGDGANSVHAIPADARSQCDLLRLPDAQSRGDVRNRCGALSCRPDPTGQRHARKLPDLETSEPRTPGNTAPERHLQAARAVTVRAGIGIPRSTLPAAW